MLTAVIRAEIVGRLEAKVSAQIAGGEPAAYLKSASVSQDGNTLTLTKKDNTTVQFAPAGPVGRIVGL